MSDAGDIHDHDDNPWLRWYIDIGRQAARERPDALPFLVELVRLAAGSGVLGVRELLDRAADCADPPPIHVIADILILADETLCDVRDIDAQLERMTLDEQRAALRWARAKHAAAGHDDQEPTMPGCVAQLYRALEVTPCAD